MWSASTPIRKRRPSRTVSGCQPFSPSSTDLVLYLSDLKPLLPLLPPPTYSPPKLRDFLRLWRNQACSRYFQLPSATAWDDSGLASFPTSEPWRQPFEEAHELPEELPSIEPDPPWLQSLLEQIAEGLPLQLPWFELKALLSNILIKRLTYRFHRHLESMYLDSPLPPDKLATYITQRSAGAYLLPPVYSANGEGGVGQFYKRDLQAFVDPRRALVWHLRSYAFPPFTLPRLCELLMLPATEATWARDFWKFAFAVQRCLIGIVSSMPVDTEAVEKAPKLDITVARRLKRTVWLIDTPTDSSGFVWMKMPGGGGEEMLIRRRLSMVEAEESDEQPHRDSSLTEDPEPSPDMFHTPQPGTRKRLAVTAAHDDEDDSSGRKRARVEEEEPSGGRQFHAEILNMHKELENGGQQPPLPPIPGSAGGSPAGDERLYDMFTACGGGW